jgi:hypothetical protein
LAYLGLVSSLLGSGGLGWGLALLLYAFVLFVAPPALLAALILAFTSRKRRTQRSFWLALLAVVVAGGLEVLTRLSKLEPRGPLG